MEKIDMFVESLYEDVVGSEDDINELKLEMKNHLLETINELKLEGKSEKEATYIAINRLGHKKELKPLISNLYKSQKVFSKWLLFLGISILLLTLIIFVSLSFINGKNLETHSKTASQVAKTFSNKSLSSYDIESKIENLIKPNDEITKVNIYKTRNDEGRDTPYYEYSKKIWSPSPIFFSSLFYPSDGTIVEFTYLDYKDIGIFFMLIGVCSYWVTFTIWATINAYLLNRINLGWIILFTLFNIFGYLIYRSFTYKPQR